jgi:hypothetical protein
MICVPVFGRSPWILCSARVAPPLIAYPIKLGTLTSIDAATVWSRNRFTLVGSGPESTTHQFREARSSFLSARFKRSNVTFHRAVDTLCWPPVRLSLLYRANGLICPRLSVGESGSLSGRRRRTTAGAARATCVLRSWSPFVVRRRVRNDDVIFGWRVIAAICSPLATIWIAGWNARLVGIVMMTRRGFGVLPANDPTPSIEHVRKF